MAQLVKERLGLPVLNLVGKTDLRQALGVLSRLKLLITNDSGLMHAAAALSVPLVALFGSTDPAATGPFTYRATVIRHPLPVQPLLQAHLRDGLCLPDRHQRGRGGRGRPSWLTDELMSHPRYSWTGTAPSTKRWAISII